MNKCSLIFKTTCFLFLIVSCSSNGGEASSSFSSSIFPQDSSLSSVPLESSSIMSSEEKKPYEPNLENRPISPSPEKDKTKPYIEVEKNNFDYGEKIIVKSFNYSEGDWIGVYKGFNEPSTYEPTTKGYAASTNTFNTKNLISDDDYSIFLLKSDSNIVLDSLRIHIGKKNFNDYSAKTASFVCGINDDGIRVSTLKITPSVTTSVQYYIYWARDGKRLDNYTHFASFKKASSEEFTIDLPEGLYMPTNANQVEVAVKNGDSPSLFVNVEGNIKLQYSEYRYSFNVLTDLHINPAKTTYSSHLNLAIDDMLYYNKDSKALFTIGDHTDNGSDEAYELLNSIMGRYTSSTETPVYYALGNHEFIYGPTFQTQVDKFLKNTKTRSVNYSLTIEGSKIIYLGTDSNIGEGSINDENIKWLKGELDSADSSMPIFIFLHTPLVDTVAGSFKKQNWYGIPENGEKIKKILENYLNVFMFTGHTHWTFESANELSLGKGKNANYINCSAVSYLWNDNNINEPGSEGFFVDVYDDYIVLKGREFVEQKWAAHGMFCIPFAKR